MPTRTVVEWRCTRCGDEEAIESGRAHDWHILSGLHDYQGNRPSTSRSRATGDVCPRCAASFLAWWDGPREHIPTEPV